MARLVSDRTSGNQVAARPELRRCMHIILDEFNEQFVACPACFEQQPGNVRCWRQSVPWESSLTDTAIQLCIYIFLTYADYVPGRAGPIRSKRGSNWRW
jgi:hypothetical protein